MPIRRVVSKAALVDFAYKDRPVELPVNVLNRIFLNLEETGGELEDMHKKKLFFLGSYFARQLEEYFSNLGSQVTSAKGLEFPSASLFSFQEISNKNNAFVIANEIKWAFGEKRFTTNLFLPLNNEKSLFLDPFGPCFVNASIADLISYRKAFLLNLQAMRDSEIIFISIENAFAWFDTKFQEYLNCQPGDFSVTLEPGRFDYFQSSFQEIESACDVILRLIKKYCTKCKRVVFVTVIERRSDITNNDFKFSERDYSSALSRVLGDSIESKFDGYVRHIVVDIL